MRIRLGRLREATKEQKEVGNKCLLFDGLAIGWKEVERLLRVFKHKADDYEFTFIQELY